MATRNYFTRQEYAEKLLARAKQDAHWNQLLSHCSLDYIHCTAEQDKLLDCAFDTAGHAVYGGSEGIYGHLFTTPLKHDTQYLIVLKTLDTDKESFLAMQGLCGLLSYHGRQLVNENLDRFD